MSTGKTMLAMSTPHKAYMDSAVTADIRRWLDDFAAAVRARDFSAGRALFADNVCAFGTRATRITGLDDLEADQWRPIWNSTRGYHFDYDDASIEVSGDIAWVAIRWHSQGKDSRGDWYDRFGRATYILRKIQGRWVATHTHHSLNPGR